MIIIALRLVVSLVLLRTNYGNFMINKIGFFLGVLVLTFIALPAPKVIAAIDVQSVSGIWQNSVGSPQPAFSQSFNGANTNFIQWGVKTSNYGQSGYKFVGNAPPTISSVPLDTPFALGTFTHYNFPITQDGGSLTSTDLAVAMNFTINGQAQVLNNVYTFLHNETPNVNLNLSNPINNDIVSFLNNTSKQQIINIGGVDYVLNLIGFSTSPDGPLVSQFSTTERQINTATLFAEFTRASVEVPEPSTYMLLAGMLLVIGMSRGRNKALV